MSSYTQTSSESSVELEDPQSLDQSALGQFEVYSSLLVEFVLELMANAFSKVALCGVIVAGGVFIYLYHRNDRGGNGGNGDQSVEIKKLIEHQRRKFEKEKEKIERERREMELENRREMEEMGRWREERRRESRRRNANQLADMEDEARMSRLRREDYRMESERTIERMKRDLQMDNFLKNEMTKLSFSTLQGKYREELSDKEEELDAMRNKNQKRIDAMNTNIFNQKREFERQEAGQQQRVREEEQRFEKKLEEIRQKLAEEMGEMQRRDAERRAEMESQLREIYRVLRNRVWNEVIENNWTRRLNTLRAANQDVSSTYRSMKSHSGDRQMLHEHSRNLLNAIEQERRLMDEEAREMDKMYKATGKSFLTEIKHSVEHVKNSCEALSASVQRDPSNMNNIDKCFADLCRASAVIPTLAELKIRYAEAMSQ